MTPGLRQYLRKVDHILDRYDARILAQGPPSTVLEGELNGVVTVIEFPSLQRAQQWYDDVEYAQLRQHREAAGDWIGVLLQGVPLGYRAASLLPWRSRSR